MSYITKTVGEKTVLGLLMTKNGVPLTGLTPTIELRRNVDGKYFDFSATVPPYWETSIGQVQLVLPECSWLGGYYSWEFDHALYDNVANEYTAIYRNTGTYPLTNIEVVSYGNTVGIDISFIRKMLANKQTLQAVATDHMIHIVYDDDLITPVYHADITLNGLTSTETRLPS
jgi:hypothetical protein